MGLLGASLIELGRLADADPLRRDALDGFRRDPGIEDHETLVVAIDLAVLFDDQRRLDAAIPPIEEMLEIQRRTRGEDNPDTLLTLAHLASNHAFGPHPERSEPLASRSVELFKAKLTVDYEMTSRVLHIHSFVLSKLKRHDEAIELATEVLDRRSRLLGREHPETRLAMRALAGIHADAERCEESRDFYEELYDVVDDWQHIANPGRSWPANELTSLCQQMQGTEGFARWQERARWAPMLLGKRRPAAPRRRYHSTADRNRTRKREPTRLRKRGAEPTPSTRRGCARRSATTASSRSRPRPTCRPRSSCASGSNRSARRSNGTT